MGRIGVGFVGAGWMGQVQMQRLVERDDVEILALYETNEGRGREVLSGIGLSPDILVASYGEILRNPDIDAVWLVSPNAFHAPQALLAMSAGKHVFSEKPMATTFSDYCALVAAQRANPGLITFVDYILAFDTMEQRLRQMVADGEFGQVTQIQVNYRHPVNIAGDKIWKLNREIMGDAIGMGINHGISVIVNLMSPQTKPVAVYATSMPAKVRGFEADPIWNIVIRFDDGATGFCFGNIDNGNGYDAYHNLFGTEGGFVFDSQLERTHKVRYWSASTTGGGWVFPLDRERCVREGVEPLAWPDDTTTPDSGNVVGCQTGAAVEHFIECVKSGVQSALSYTNSAVIAEIGWAARISSETGRTIDLPLDWTAAKELLDR